MVIATAAALTMFLTTAPVTHAAKNNGAYQRSLEAKHARICADLKTNYDINMNYYKAKPAKREKWKNNADDLHTIAESNNCAWAQ
jgi:hypothetical protein